MSLFAEPGPGTEYIDDDSQNPMDLAFVLSRGDWRKASALLGSGCDSSEAVQPSGSSAPYPAWFAALRAPDAVEGLRKLWDQLRPHVDQVRSCNGCRLIDHLLTTTRTWVPVARLIALGVSLEGEVEGIPGLTSWWLAAGRFPKETAAQLSTVANRDAILRQGPPGALTVGELLRASGLSSPALPIVEHTAVLPASLPLDADRPPRNGTASPLITRLARHAQVLDAEQVRRGLLPSAWWVTEPESVVAAHQAKKVARLEPCAYKAVEQIFVALCSDVGGHAADATRRADDDDQRWRPRQSRPAVFSLFDRSSMPAERSQQIQTLIQEFGLPAYIDANGLVTSWPTHTEAIAERIYQAFLPAFVPVKDEMGLLELLKALRDLITVLEILHLSPDMNARAHDNELSERLLVRCGLGEVWPTFPWEIVNATDDELICWYTLARASYLAFRGHGHRGWPSLPRIGDSEAQTHLNALAADLRQEIIAGAGSNDLARYPTLNRKVLDEPALGLESALEADIRIDLEPRTDRGPRISLLEWSLIHDQELFEDLKTYVCARSWPLAKAEMGGDEAWGMLLQRPNVLGLTLADTARLRGCEGTLALLASDGLAPRSIGEMLRSFPLDISRDAEPMVLFTLERIAEALDVQIDIPKHSGHSTDACDRWGSARHDPSAWGRSWLPTTVALLQKQAPV